MTLPNKLTVTRLILSPVVFLWYFSNRVLEINPVLYTVVLLIIYSVMELSDLLDGKIARKHRLVTDLGKVMDPFGDVMSHLTFFTCFLASGIMPVLPFILIIWREFAQSFTRMLLMGKGKPMAANIFGKTKTCLYALCTVIGLGFHCAELFTSCPSWLNVTLDILFYAAACASVASYLVYIRNIIKQGILKDMTR